MSYKIYHSNSLPEFISRYSSLFHSDSLFGEKVVTVVQNSNIASWLKLELAKTDGILMDLNVEYPENAVKKLVSGYKSGNELFNSGEEGKSLLFMDSFKIVVFKTLEELLVNEREFPNLYKYVKGSSQRLFQLSDSIAGLFYHYGMNCPLMVASWDRNELYISKNGKILREEDQKWQMSLWRYIFNENTPYIHISNVLNRVLESGESYNPDISEFGKCRIILFGSSFLGESAIKFFNYLSRDVDVHHFILTPSEIYTRENDSRPFSLLNRFSGLINGFTNISREPEFIKERVSFLKEFGGDSLLEKLKEGIRCNSFEEERKASPISLTPGDSSIKICKVTGRWREIEILKDKILDLLSSDTSLKLTDIGVVAPDISGYTSYIEGIFSEKRLNGDGTTYYGKGDLPYNIIGIKGGEDSPYIRGLLSLLDIPGSSFNRKDIAELITNPCFMERFSITSNIRELFLETIDSLNIKWGVDGSHREELGYGNDDFNTWERGFKRIFLGIALNREDGRETIPFNMGDSQGIESLGELVHIVRSLYSDLWGLNSLRLNMDEWVLFIETVMDTYLKPVKDDIFDERERLGVKNQYRNILNLLDDLKNLSNFRKRDIPFAVFKSLLKEFIVKSANNRGRYLTQGITFSSLKPLRAVPFKHIFVLGLGEDEFPGKEKIPSYDLRGIYDQKIDLSKRQNDKYAFLELILSAGESLTLFYSSRNQISGEELQPSVVINELLEAVELNFNIKEESLVESHPLHNFDSSYFGKESSLTSYNRRAYDSSLAYQGEKREPYKIEFDEDNTGVEPLRVTVKELIQFIKNPVKTFFTRGEGIYLEDEGSIEEDIYENRELDFLTRWKLANLVLERGLTESVNREEICDHFFRTAEAEGVLKGSVLTDNIEDDISDTIEGIDYFLTEYGLKGTPYRRVNRELDGEFTPLKFNIDGQEVTLGGELEDLWVDSTSCFVTDISLNRDSGIKTRNKIQPYIYSNIIMAHPEMREDSFTAYSVGRGMSEPLVLERAEDPYSVLENILSLYIKNLRKPIPLYPDIMTNDGVDAIKNSWEESLNSRNYSVIRECPYIKMAYQGRIPEFDKDDIEMFYNAVYREIGEKRKEK